MMMRRRGSTRRFMVPAWAAVGGGRGRWFSRAGEATALGWPCDCWPLTTPFPVPVCARTLAWELSWAREQCWDASRLLGEATRHTTLACCCLLVRAFAALRREHLPRHVVRGRVWASERVCAQRRRPTRCCARRERWRTRSDRASAPLLPFQPSSTTMTLPSPLLALLLVACLASRAAAQPGWSCCACGPGGCIADARGFYCHVTQPAACPGATPSVAYPGAAWVECSPEHAAGVAASATATAVSAGGKTTPLPQATAGSASATAEAQADAVGCGLATAVAQATATATGVLPPAQSNGQPSTLRLSASAYAEARAYAFSPGCLKGSASARLFGCALAEAVAYAETDVNVDVTASGNNVPIRLTVSATATAVATSEARSILGSGRCPGKAGGKAGGAYLAR